MDGWREGGREGGREGRERNISHLASAFSRAEPTSMRAIRARYDPYKQARSRVEQLERLGHVR